MRLKNKTALVTGGASGLGYAIAKEFTLHGATVMIADIDGAASLRAADDIAAARALLDGRLAPSVDDALMLAEPVLKHRMALSFAARADGETVEGVIRRLKTTIA